MDQENIAVLEREEDITSGHVMTLEEADAGIRNGLKDAARSVIVVGYYLKGVRDHKLYLTAGYENIWDYAAQRFGFSKSTASRYMTRNDRFSVGGNSPVLAEEFREYSKAQLQEMLSLDAEQMSAVTPGMTVREIRELRRPKEIPYFEIPGQLSLSDFPELDDAETEDPVVENSAPTEAVTSTTAFTVSAEDLIGEPEEAISAYGLPKTVYPPDSLISCPGCKGDSGRGYSCFNCHMECGIRQEYCYCVEAAMGNPFPCAMVGSGMVETLRQEIGESCQFVNLDLAERKVGTDEPVPCCQQCANPCAYACQISKKRVATSQQKEPTVLPNGGENAAEKQRSGKCLHNPEHTCTLADAEKVIPGTGKDCTHSCCWECPNHRDCNIECYASSRREYQPEDEDQEESAPGPIEYDHDTLEKMIKEARGILNQMKDYWLKSQPYTYTKYSMMIQAYEALMKSHEAAELKPKKAEQPELPRLKNNDQRATFVDDYESWPLWINNQETGEKYYRYDLPDGTSFVVKVYHAMIFRGWEAESGSRYEEGYGLSEQYILEPGKFFRDCRTNRSAMIEKLKELQKSE